MYYWRQDQCHFDTVRALLYLQCSCITLIVCWTEMETDHCSDTFTPEISQKPHRGRRKKRSKVVLSFSCDHFCMKLKPRCLPLRWASHHKFFDSLVLSSSLPVFSFLLLPPPPVFIISSILCVLSTVCYLSMSRLQQSLKALFHVPELCRNWCSELQCLPYWGGQDLLIKQQRDLDFNTPLTTEFHWLRSN